MFKIKVALVVLVLSASCLAGNDQAAQKPVMLMPQECAILTKEYPVATYPRRSSPTKEYSPKKTASLGRGSRPSGRGAKGAGIKQPRKSH